VKALLAFKAVSQFSAFASMREVLDVLVAFQGKKINDLLATPLLK
jgi:hypothetical protein